MWEEGYYYEKMETNDIKIVYAACGCLPDRRGVSGGMSFVRYFKPIYFVYGIFMTLLPMVVGYIVAKHVLKMNLLNILGSITAGMTSTPALGTLIHVAGTSNVASAYAATYPIALIDVVLVSQLLVRLF